MLVSDKEEEGNKEFIVYFYGYLSKEERGQCLSPVRDRVGIKQGMMDDKVKDFEVVQLKPDPLASFFEEEVHERIISLD